MKMAFVAALLVFFEICAAQRYGVSFTEKAQKCPKGYKKIGNPTSTVQTSKTCQGPVLDYIGLDLCKVICNGDPACKAFRWQPKPKKCWVFGCATLTQGNGDKGIVCGKRPQCPSGTRKIGGPRATIETSETCQAPFLDGIGLADCDTICKGDPTCAAFRWQPDPVRCTLFGCAKLAAPNAKIAKGIVCKSAPKCPVGTEQIGTKLSTVDTSSKNCEGVSLDNIDLAFCDTICKGDPGCAAFRWQPKPRKCTLFGCSGLTTTNGPPGLVCKSEPKCPRGTTLIGNKLSTVDTSADGCEGVPIEDLSLSSCDEFCKGDPSCAAFRWQQKPTVCTLFGCAGLTTQNGIASGIVCKSDPKCPRGTTQIGQKVGPLATVDTSANNCEGVPLDEINLELCDVICKGDPSCAAFRWQPKPERCTLFGCSGIVKANGNETPGIVCKNPAPAPSSATFEGTSTWLGAAGVGFMVVGGLWFWRSKKAANLVEYEQL